MSGREGEYPSARVDRLLSEWIREYEKYYKRLPSAEEIIRQEIILIREAMDRLFDCLGS